MPLAAITMHVASQTAHKNFKSLFINDMPDQEERCPCAHLPQSAPWPMPARAFCTMKNPAPSAGPKLVMIKEWPPLRSPAQPLKQQPESSQQNP
jgi:hypothetical protein